MNYLANIDNVVLTADLTATNIVGSQLFERADADPKAGGGHVTLSGEHTGGSDVFVEVEIFDQNSTQRSISAPQLNGVGNGVLSDVAATNAVAPQLITLSLIDLGTETRHAYAPFQSVTLRAKTSGEVGNDLRVEVDPDALVTTPTAFALREPLRAGVNEYVGDHWNFAGEGAASDLNADGTIKATAPRIRFGDDPQVYRAYRTYKQGKYVYGFSPSPVRDVPKGLRVYDVSGTYTVVIRSGSTVHDTLPGIVTLYDCLLALQGSSVVAVDGVGAINDLRPNGQASTDLSVWTRPYVAGTVREGTDYIKEADIQFKPTLDAPSQELEIRCIEAGTPNMEVWKVRGEVDGTMPNAVTGVTYTATGFEFMIPIVPGIVGDTAGKIYVNYERPGWDGQSPLPVWKAFKAVLGKAAKNGKWTFVYRPRPIPECEENGEIIGQPNFKCLGVFPPEGSFMSEAAIRRRAEALRKIQRDAVQFNTDMTVNGGMRVEPRDIDFINRGASILGEGLVKMYTGTVENMPWEASTPVTQDEVRESTDRNGFRFVVDVVGTTGTTEPSWNTAVGSTTTDNGVVWRNLGPTAPKLWDLALGQYEEDIATIQGFASGNGNTNGVRQTWFHLAQLVDNFGASMLALPGTRVYPGESNGHVYIVTAFVEGTDLSTGTLGTSEPTWPTDGGTVLDEIVYWRDEGAYWTASSVVAQGTKINVGYGEFEAVQGGTTGTTEPLWTIEANYEQEDGTVKWKRVSVGAGNQLSGTMHDQFFERYVSMMNYVLIAAGISPDFDIASGQGDGCWRDFEEGDGWFVFSGDEPYCPVQPGIYYHATKFSQDDRGNEISNTTFEFGFGPQFGCPELIAVNDIITVRIDGINGRTTYQEGDTATVTVNRALPLEFGGGQTGTDKLTWAVIGGVLNQIAQFEMSSVIGAESTYDDSGLSFKMKQGGIKYALGDQYLFQIEAGRYRYRFDGGAWQGPFDVGPIKSLQDGLDANFYAGVAPSWMTGDKWSYWVRASNGVDNIRSPSEPRLVWEGDTVIDITPTGDSAIDCMMMAEHTIPSDATITLEGSDDGFATTPLSRNIPWKADTISLMLDGEHGEYRLTIDRPGSLQWLFLGRRFRLSTQGGWDYGRTVVSYTPPTALRGAARAYSITHDMVTQESTDALQARLAWACENDTRRLGVILNSGVGSLVEVREEPIAMNDVFDYQGTEEAFHVLSYTLNLDPVT